MCTGGEGKYVSCRYPTFTCIASQRRQTHGHGWLTLPTYFTVIRSLWRERLNADWPSQHGQRLFSWSRSDFFSPVDLLKGRLRNDTSLCYQAPFPASARCLRGRYPYGTQTHPLTSHKHQPRSADNTDTRLLLLTALIKGAFVTPLLQVSSEWLNIQKGMCEYLGIYT